MPMVDDWTDDCPHCGAPPFWQDPHWQAPTDQEIEDGLAVRLPGFCPHCGAITDDEGKHEH